MRRPRALRSQSAVSVVLADVSGEALRVSYEEALLALDRSARKVGKRNEVGCVEGGAGRKQRSLWNVGCVHPVEQQDRTTARNASARGVSPNFLRRAGRESNERDASNAGCFSGRGRHFAGHRYEE